MNIVLTNDDGFHAPGLLAAFHALRDLGDVHVIAPHMERSSCGHGITTGRPITAETIQDDVFGASHRVEGTPADCVRIAEACLLRRPIDLVVSGVNRGANAGVDVYYSGTIAGAREAAILGYRAIALSQSTRPGVPIDWTAVTSVTRTLVHQLVREELPGTGFWSVNYPAPIPADLNGNVHRVPVAESAWPIEFEEPDGPHGGVRRFTYAAPYWDRRTQEHTDYTVIRDGGIAISAVPLFCRF